MSNLTSAWEIAEQTATKVSLRVSRRSELGREIISYLRKPTNLGDR